ncbi:winged helix-turn-helix domain-containing protein [Sphingomonas sp. M1-B02]|uniref:winged helix-turn-helix domain-containing protein n=1 Tax=Sphingomonas sp. M1-B02 TaxID=3114300 RepID=UPI0022407F17|nr:transcriptional regulator [Sphingomonas sp. S6-11]UZK65650.1 transcriptional regulator [Sphingomonas sp. S6-11]
MSMGAGPVHSFGDFRLDEREKQLWRGDERVAVNPRYFDALVLLVRNAGGLVDKDRFFDEVWRGMTVGDEALTQCIKSLRKALGDLHSDPLYIETVPKRGYRFIAEVSPRAPAPVTTTPPRQLATPLQLATAGTLGGAFAGAVGGVIYGLAAVGSDGSALSILFVLIVLTLIVGLLGGLGVSFGMAAASLVARRDWLFSLLGAGVGGLVVGGAFNMLGNDSLHLLFGRAPSQITGGLEGAILGVALAAGARLGGGLDAPGWRAAIGAGVGCGAGGVLACLGGGRLMGGSLSAVAALFDQSRLRLDSIGRMLGEASFGPVAQTITAGTEGFLFGLCVVGAILFWRRHRRDA